MRKLLLSVVLVGFFAAPAFAQEKPVKPAEKAAGPQTVSFTAQVVDLSCKILNNASGPDHQMCAQVCADKGQPLGLLTADGTFYVPVNKGMGADGENVRLRPLAEQSVQVTGKLVKRNGINSIAIESIERVE